MHVIPSCSTINEIVRAGNQVDACLNDSMGFLRLKTRHPPAAPLPVPTFDERDTAQNREALTKSTDNLSWPRLCRVYDEVFDNGW